MTRADRLQASIDLHSVPDSLLTSYSSQAFLAVWLLAASAGGCGAERGATPPTLIIASDATFPPFHYIADGTATGFDIELAALVARRAGFEPRIVVRPYEQLFTGLREGAHDLVAATTGVTPERELEHLFTRPYFETAQAILVRVGPDEPAGLADLVGRRVGAGGDGTSARAMMGIEGAEPVVLGSGETAEAIIDERGGAVPVLEDGFVDALIVDEFDAVRAARASNGRLRALPEPAALEEYAFVLRLGRHELKALLDRALGELEEEGALDSLRREFGVIRDSDWPVGTRR